MNRPPSLLTALAPIVLVAACHGGGNGGTGGAGAGAGGGPPPPDCSAGCPAGYACTDGVCTGGDAQAIDFDVKTFTVSGKLRVDGQAPHGNGCSGGQVRIELLSGPSPAHIWDPDLGNNIHTLIDCATSDGSFAVQVPAGTYRVQAYRYDSSSSFPDATFVIDPAFTVSGPQAGLAWDLTTVPVSGQITVDGQAPLGNGCSGDQVRIDLVNSDGADFPAFVPCTSSNGSFSARVAPGTYRVLAYRYDSGSSFPDATFVVDGAFSISAAKTGITWSLTTAPVSGQITVDGLAPHGNGCSGDQVRIDLVNDDGADFAAFVPCTSSTGSFSARVAPGSYRVLAYRYDSSSSFPDATFLVDGAFALSGAKTGLAWSLTTAPVGGHIRVDGQAPLGNGCSGDQVRVNMLDTEGAYFSAFISCNSSDGSYATRVAPGTYRFLAYPYDSSSSFPDATFNLQDAIAIP